MIGGCLSCNIQGLSSALSSFFFKVLVWICRITFPTINQTGSARKTFWRYPYCQLHSNVTGKRELHHVGGSWVLARKSLGFPHFHKYISLAGFFISNYAHFVLVWFCFYISFYCCIPLDYLCKQKMQGINAVVKIN